MRKKIALLGSTGSIGRQTLEVIRSLNKDFNNELTVVALAAGENIKLLAAQIREFKPLLVSIKNQQDIDLLKRELGRRWLKQKVKLLHGEAGLKEIAAYQEADLVINGLVGASGLIPTLETIRAGKDIGLANKESLVIGGHLVKEELKKSESKIIPIDSEHSAIFQLLQKVKRSDVVRIMLTASGGALRDRPSSSLDKVTPEEVLAHPNWDMGPRITVDSATLVNKGFEVIEAHWLFAMPYNQIEVLIHPQAVVHGLIELKDGSILGQMSYPDMRIPIQYALTYPERFKNESFPQLSLNLRGLELAFAEVDLQRYPAFKYIVEAGKVGGTLPAALNAADEVLVEKFLKREIRFTDIARGLEKVFQAHENIFEPDLAGILSADGWAREYLKSRI